MPEVPKRLCLCVKRTKALACEASREGINQLKAKGILKGRLVISSLSICRGYELSGLHSFKGSRAHHANDK